LPLHGFAKRTGRRQWTGHDGDLVNQSIVATEDGLDGWRAVNAGSIPTWRTIVGADDLSWLSRTANTW
jgi:hypothetical protein